MKRRMEGRIVMAVGGVARSDLRRGGGGDVAMVRTRAWVGVWSEEMTGAGVGGASWAVRRLWRDSQL